MSRIDSTNNDNDNVIIVNFKGDQMFNSHVNDTSEPADRPLLRWTGRPEIVAPEVASRRPRRRAGGKAKKLTEADFQKLVAYVETKRYSSVADRLKIDLSFMAGLRACEIAGLRISDVTNADGSTASTIQVRANITKNNRAREVPVCAELKRSINAFRVRYPDSEWLAVSHRYNTVKHQSANAVTVWFHYLYKKFGFEKCSSHSGRRTFITEAGRNLPPGCSLRDVQVIVGHARLDTTQAYIESSSDIQPVVDVVGAMLTSKSKRRDA